MNKLLVSAMLVLFVLLASIGGSPHGGRGHGYRRYHNHGGNNGHNHGGGSGHYHGGGFGHHHGGGYGGGCGRHRGHHNHQNGDDAAIYGAGVLEPRSPFEVTTHRTIY